MGRRVLAGAAVVAVSCLAMVAASQAARASSDLLKVRLGGDSSETRIVIDLSQGASARVVSEGGRRVVLILSGVDAPVALQGVGQGLVKTWIVDDGGSGARLSMDLSADARVRRRFLLPPADGVQHYRYVIDLAATEAAPVVLTKLQPGNAPPLKKMPITQKLSLKRVIVIDAGHGGKDVGAQGVQSYEKDLNLAAAQALKARLERGGRYKVVMTRDSDVFVPLESRVRIAQHAGADLFISLHSDSGPDTATRGASVYTLSDKASARGAKFASRDDWFMKASMSGDSRVSDILFDLTQRATKNRSAAFAQTLVSNVEGKAPLLRRSHRDAGFVVLLAPDVPAVLLEMGFVSNQEDERMLRDSGSRNRFMGAVGDAIDDYFAQSTRLASR